MTLKLLNRSEKRQVISQKEGDIIVQLVLYLSTTEQYHWQQSKRNEIYTKQMHIQTCRLKDQRVADTVWIFQAGQRGTFFIRFSYSLLHVL